MIFFDLKAKDVDQTNLTTRFSVFQLLVGMVVAAVFCVALFNENEWWRATLGTVTSAMILNSLLAAIFAKGKKRAFALSFFAGAGFCPLMAYTYVASLPFLITRKLMLWINEFTSSPLSQENFYVVASIFWIQVTCWISGYIGLAWYNSSESSKSPALSEVTCSNE